jgi:hypothetical protein
LALPTTPWVPPKPSQLTLLRPHAILTLYDHELGCAGPANSNTTPAGGPRLASSLSTQRSPPCKAPLTTHAQEHPACLRHPPLTFHQDTQSPNPQLFPNPHQTPHSYLKVTKRTLLHGHMPSVRA